MADYGTLDGVAAFVGHMTDVADTFTMTTTPTAAQVEAFLVQISARLTGWLSAAGYVVPVAIPAAKAILDGYANLGAAGLCELAQRTGGYSSDEPNRRENKFLSEFARAEGYIQSRALAALGVPQVLIGDLAASQPAIGTIAAGTTSDLTRRLPPEWR